MPKSSAASASTRFPWRRSAYTRMNIAPLGRWTWACRVGATDQTSWKWKLCPRQPCRPLMLGQSDDCYPPSGGVAGYPGKETQCHPIGNMLKTIDFIGVFKIGGRFNRHTPSHSVWSWQKALIFDGFHAFPVG